jgi:hypothetical protein
MAARSRRGRDAPAAIPVKIVEHTCGSVASRRPIDAVRE